MFRIRAIGVIAVLCAMAFGASFGAETGASPMVVAVFDSWLLRGRTDPVAELLRDALRDNGCEVVVLTPHQAADPERVNRGRLDALIYLGSDHTIPIGQRCVDYLKQGGRLWYIGDASPFSGTAFTAGHRPGEFVPASRAISEAARMRRAGTAGPNAVPAPTSLQLTRQIHRGSAFTWRSIAAGKIIDPPSPQPGRTSALRDPLLRPRHRHGRRVLQLR